MLYVLLIIGIIIMIYGWKVYQYENKSRKEIFQEIVVEEQRNNGDYLSLIGNYQNLREEMVTLEDKLDKIMDKLDELQPVEPLENKPDKKSEEAILQKEDTNISYGENRKEQVKEQGKKYPLSSDYTRIAKQIEEMEQENQSIEEMATSLGMGKGEVLLLKNLLKK